MEHVEIRPRFERRTKYPFVKVWKPLPNIRVLKTLRVIPKEKVKEDNICRWVDTRWCGPWRRVDLVGSHIDWRKEWVRARTLGPEGWIVRSHVDLWGKVDLVGSHNDWRKKRVSSRMLGPEGCIVRSHVDLWGRVDFVRVPHRLEKGTSATKDVGLWGVYSEIPRRFVRESGFGGGLTLIGERNECERWHWVLKGVLWDPTSGLWGKVD